MAKNTHKILIIRKSDGKTVKEMAAGSLRDAARIENGANINLNHDEYYTKIEPIEGVASEQADVHSD